MEDLISASGNVDESLLEIIAECRASYDGASGEAKRKIAATLVYAGVQALRNLVGDDALASAYGIDPDPAAPRSEHLQRLASRLSLARQMFASADDAAQSSMLSAFDEINAIAAGDEPRLFGQLSPAPGEKPRTNAHRMASHRLKILRWYEFLLTTGQEKGKARNLIWEIFGVEWGTLSKWPAIVRRELGEERYRRAMRQAQALQDLLMPYSLDEAKRRMAKDNDLFQQEKRKEVALSMLKGGKE